MTDLIASCRLAEVTDHSSDLIVFSLIVPYIFSLRVKTGVGTVLELVGK